MYLTQAIRRSFQQSPQVTATISGGRNITFAQLEARIRRLASGLRSLGVSSGDRVGMLAHNCDHFLEFYFATYWAGGVVNPINTRWSVAEIAYSLNDCDTQVLVVDRAHVDLVAEIKSQVSRLRATVYIGEDKLPPDAVSYEVLIEASSPVDDAMRHGDDIAGIFYTGGTTGAPKGVMLTHSNLYTNAMAMLAEVAVPKSAIGLHVAPMFHAADIMFMNGLVMRGATHVMLPTFDPITVLTEMETQQITDCLLVPTMIRMLVDHPERSSYDVSSVRRIIYGASPIDETLLDRAMEAFPQAAFYGAYGMTELSPLATVLPPECHAGEHRAVGRLRSAGQAAVCAELLIVDESDRPVSTGTLGEILVRGPGIMKGYLNKIEETQTALRGGWMHTGDIGYVDSDGFLFVVDRLKDMIVSGGENVYSAEVENALLKHPSIAMCAVIGLPDPEWGERVHAVLVLRAGAEAPDVSTLREHTKQYIAGYKCPRSVEFRSVLPLSAAGKVLKSDLRAPYWENRSRKVS